MSRFKQNIEKWNSIKQKLAPYGLAAVSGAVIDKTLPRHMHCVVCRFDQVRDVESSIFLSENPVISNWLLSRVDRIREHKREQAEAAAWANRPDLHA
ncbi:hypothetical protein [Halioglobus sp. HI00S01]|uniref:hypothetical protein n=1 Tax=Halioglobus sp. HI00S01 TaxID=1822214 RepID=UPI0012E7CDBB|nr:hypothetical protein [Halioglobus sp. HI00S01]